MFQNRNFICCYSGRCNIILPGLRYRLSSDGQDFFTSYDEVYDSFDAMGLQENLLRGIYAYGESIFLSLFFICIGDIE